MTMKTHINSHVNGHKQLAPGKVRNPLFNQQLSISSSVVQLQQILQKPTQFVPATQLTVADQAKMKSNSTTSSGDYDEYRPDIPGDRRLAGRAEVGPGFRNTMNDCYINSLVIALLHVPKFVNWLEKAHQLGACPVSYCVACALTNLSLAYWATNRDRRRAESEMVAFKKVIHNATTIEIPGWSKSKQGHQHDVQEFYSWVLSKLREQDTLYDHALEDLFFLSVKTSSTCLQCCTPGHNMEHECQLILSCQSISHIDEALDREFASDVKSNIECGSEACKNTRVEKEYSKTLARAPDILCIQFNRFRVTNAGTKKNTRQIGFDEELDLSRFTKRHASLRYRLMAVVHHRGSWEFGHYISMTRRDRDCWYRQDDESVKEVGLNDVLEPMGEFTPYLLFWAKVRPRKEIPNAPSPKERPCGEMSVPRLDEIGQSPSKISSKKRSREEAQTATERETERPPLKSAKTSNVLANDTHISPRPESISRSRWPSRWLWGGLEISDKTQQAEKKLLEWQKEHERKDELIEQQKGLIRRAAVTHAQLVVSLALLNASYEESRQATDIIHPIIRNIHARGKEKYGNKAGKLLQLAKSARDRLRGGSYAFNVSERIARLVEPLTAEDAENEELPAFIAAVNEARSEDRLEAWLDEELTTSGLPIGA